MSFGRKFWAMVIALVCLTAVMLLSLMAVAPTPVTAQVIIVYFTLVVTVIFMFVGGNVWKSWIKSKYFRPELADKER